MIARPDPMLDLSIERRFDVPPALVFRQWADSALRQRWWGPTGFACSAFASDFRPGGAWSATISSPAQGQHSMAGVYREIEADRLIRFSFRWTSDAEPHETEIIVTLTPTAYGGTLQRFSQGPFPSLSSRDGHAEGWAECLERQARALEDQS
jgi:uncharacterized protein YndB with AHSA1/START domain